MVNQKHHVVAFFDRGLASSNEDCLRRRIGGDDGVFDVYGYCGWSSEVASILNRSGLEVRI